MRTHLHCRQVEYRALLISLGIASGLAVVGLVITGHGIHIPALMVVGLLAVVRLARVGVRWVRERIEDAIDARTAAAWRAHHLRIPAEPERVAGRPVEARAGVA